MILCKISLEFLEEHFSETVRCIGLKFSEITETVMPFQYSAFFYFLSIITWSEVYVNETKSGYKNSPVG